MYKGTIVYDGDSFYNIGVNTSDLFTQSVQCFLRWIYKCIPPFRWVGLPTGFLVSYDLSQDKVTISFSDCKECWGFIEEPSEYFTIENALEFVQKEFFPFLTTLVSEPEQ